MARLTYNSPRVAINYNPNNDFMTNLGTILGTIWGENWNRRGENRGTETGQNIIENYGKTDGQYSSYSDYLNSGDSATAQQPVEVGKINPDWQQNAPKTPVAVGIGNNVNTPWQSRFNASVGIGAEQGQQANPGGYMDYIRPKTSAVSDVGTARRNASPIYSLEDMEAKIRMQLRKDGRSQHQIEAAIENLRPAMKARLGQLNGSTFDDLHQTFIGQLQKGEVDNAGLTLAQMAKYDPERAAYLKNQLDRHATRVKNDEAMRYKFEAYKKAFPGYSDEEIYRMVLGGDYMDPRARDAQKQAWAMSKYGEAGSNGGQIMPSIFDSPEYKEALAISTRLGEKLATNGKLLDDELVLYDNANEFLTRAANDVYQRLVPRKPKAQPPPASTASPQNGLTLPAGGENPAIADPLRWKKEAEEARKQGKVVGWFGRYFDPNDANQEID